MTTYRRELTRAERQLLYLEANEKCQLCGDRITFETFHVAHLRAVASGGATHESNLQAWCPHCNLTNGKRDAGDPRLLPKEWQSAALNKIADVIGQFRVATVVAAPGAGKTLFSGLVFEALREAGFVKRMVAFVPNRTLVDQWADRLAAQRHIQLKPGEAMEREGQHGVVVTYQSLQNPNELRLHRLQHDANPTLYVLDEVHHLGERERGGVQPAWSRNVQSLLGGVDTGISVAGVLNLSGTLWRSKPNERISTVRYIPAPDDANKILSTVDYEVTVEELVERRQLRAIDLYRLDGRIHIADHQNLEFIESNLSDLDEPASRATMAALGDIDAWREGFVSAVLDRLREAHEALENHYVKGLIVASSQEQARLFKLEVDRQMQDRGLRPLAVIAVSDDKDADKQLEDFRKQKRVGVLCTVNMAGEGYDCPEIAVIGYASNRLTPLYVRQVVGRAQRVTDKERELHSVIPAAVVLPDSPQLVEIMASYLGRYTYEVLVEPDETPEEREFRERKERLEERSGKMWKRFEVENAEVTRETITIADADGTREDIQRSVLELLRPYLDIPERFHPRVVAGLRRGLRDIKENSPFAQPGADMEAMEALVTGAARVDAASRDPVVRSSTIEEQSRIIQRELHRWEGWWAKNGDKDIAEFVSLCNQAGGVMSGERGSASVEQLRAVREAERRFIAQYVRRTGIKPPSGWRER